MPPSDDIEHKSGEAVEGCASGAVNIASISPDDNATGDDKKSSNESHTDEISVDALSNDHIMPQEFTFFQKKKRADQGVLTQGFAYASIEQITAFSAQLDSVSAANARTKRHIAELMTERRRVVTGLIPTWHLHRGAVPGTGNGSSLNGIIVHLEMY